MGIIPSEEKGQRLAVAFSEAIKSGQLVFETVSDVRSEEGSRLGFKSIKYVLHTASPSPFNVEDPVKDLLSLPSTEL
ncbi:Hypothetical protein YALI2_F00043g [Yarrowia lipolytica]|jgi:hypothetical protein|nr:Hypothetical protein YALI2_F00043g [Yarrowia lipolytica]